MSGATQSLPSRVTPPGPPRRPGAALRALRRDPLGLLCDLAGYGDVALFRAGPQRIYLVSHPDLVEEVLVGQARAFMKGRALQEAKRLLGEGLLTSEGELHLRQRRLIQPLFHRERIDGYGVLAVEHAERAAARWSAGEEIDVAAEMARLTLAIVGTTLFDADVEGDAAEVGEALTTALALFDRFLLPWAGALEHLPLPSTRRFKAAERRLDAVVSRLIDERRGDPRERGDLLSLLLAARDEGGNGMADRQVRDEAMTIFLAGHETTAQALSWAWYLLSGHPDAEACLQAELAEVLGERAAAARDLPSLPYTRAVVAETLRLYPPAWVVGRRALRDVELGGYRVAEGSIVAVSQYVVHRDPRWWANADRFDPQRWLVEAPDRPRFAYFPFGAGNRLCAGERFAWMEAVLCLATIARRVRFRLVPGHPVAVTPTITLRPRHGLRMTVTQRSCDGERPQAAGCATKP